MQNVLNNSSVLISFAEEHGSILNPFSESLKNAAQYGSIAIVQIMFTALRKITLQNILHPAIHLCAQTTDIRGCC